jgi:hypothetical protein
VILADRVVIAVDLVPEARDALRGTAVVSTMSEDERQRRDDEKREHEESECRRLAWINPR